VLPYNRTAPASAPPLLTSTTREPLWQDYRRLNYDTTIKCATNLNHTKLLQDLVPTGVAGILLLTPMQVLYLDACPHVRQQQHCQERLGAVIDQLHCTQQQLRVPDGKHTLAHCSTRYRDARVPQATGCTGHPIHTQGRRHVHTAHLHSQQACTCTHACTYIHAARPR
jgi:hypothetical protein